MLPSPRMIAIDDNSEHLKGIANGLAAQGAACLPILFKGNPAEVKECRYVRVIFADLHLNDSGTNTPEQHFSLIGGLLQENLKPCGPYLIILWTRFADQAAALQKFLVERLTSVPKPLGVFPLDKNDHLSPDGTVQDIDKLMAAIGAILNHQNQIAALFNWEERVLGAAAETVAAIMDVSTVSQGDSGAGPLYRNCGDRIDRIGQDAGCHLAGYASALRVSRQ